MAAISSLDVIRIYLGFVAFLQDPGIEILFLLSSIFVRILEDSFDSFRILWDFLGNPRSFSDPFILTKDLFFWFLGISVRIFSIHSAGLRSLGFLAILVVWPGIWNGPGSNGLWGIGVSWQVRLKYYLKVDDCKTNRSKQVRFRILKLIPIGSSVVNGSNDKPGTFTELNPVWSRKFERILSDPIEGFLWIPYGWLKGFFWIQRIWKDCEGSFPWLKILGTFSGFFRDCKRICIRMVKDLFNTSGSF